MKKYFSYTFVMLCGIPNVSLDGTKQDWLEIESRLAKLDSWDDKTRAWRRMLAPVISKFVRAFDGEVDSKFWSHIVHHRSFGSGSSIISGWITAFSVFAENGKWLGVDHVRPDGGSDSDYILDGVSYPAIDSIYISSGSAEVDIKIIDSTGAEWSAFLMAGNMGMKVVGRNRDTVQSVPMWFYCLKESEVDKFRKQYT
jgi:Domain of unknown function (DUF4419)